MRLRQNKIGLVAFLLLQDMVGGNLTLWADSSFRDEARIRIRENLSVSFKGNAPHRFSPKREILIRLLGFGLCMLLAACLALDSERRSLQELLV